MFLRFCFLHFLLQPTPPDSAVRFNAAIDKFNIWDTKINDLHFTNFREAIKECINGCGAIVSNKLNLRAIFDDTVDTAGFTDGYVLTNDDANNPQSMIQTHVVVDSLIFARDDATMKDTDWNDLIHIVYSKFGASLSGAGPDHDPETQRTRCTLNGRPRNRHWDRPL